MPKIKSDYQGKNGGFYIVNKAGAIHSCTKAQATHCLRKQGYRMAEDVEIVVYLENRVQAHDNPIAEPWNPEPIVIDDIPETDEDGAKKLLITDAAKRLAKEANVNPKDVKATGANGTVTKPDVEAHIAKQKPA